MGSRRSPRVLTLDAREGGRSEPAAPDATSLPADPLPEGGSAAALLERRRAWDLERTAYLERQKARAASRQP